MAEVQFGAGELMEKDRACHANHRSIRSRIGVVLLVTIALMSAVSCSRDAQARYRFYQARADRFAQEKKYSEALIEYRNAIRQDPKAVDAYWGAGQAAFALGEYRRAFEAYLKVIELQPDHLAAHARLASMYLTARQMDKAREHANRVVQLDSSNAEGHRLLGEIFLNENRPADAIPELEKALQADTANPAAYERLAFAELAIKDSAKAEHYFKKAVEIGPGEDETYVNLGRFYGIANNAPAQEAILQAGIQAVPTSGRLKLELASLYFRNRRADEGEQVIAALRSQKPEPAGMELMIGELYASFGMEAEALAAFREAARQAPDDAAVQNRLVELLLGLNQIDEAAKLNDAVLSRNRSDITARLHAGSIQAARGQLDGAIVTLKTVSKDAPENVTAHYQLALTLLRQDNVAQARTELERCVSLNPNYAPALNRLAEMSVRAGDPDAALRYARQSVAAVPANFDAYIALGNASILKKDPTAARAAFASALQVRPGDAGARERIGYTYLLQGNEAKGAAELEAALAANPNLTSALADLTSYWIGKRQPARAVARIERQLRLAFSNPEMYYLLAQAHTVEAHWQPAVEALQHATSLNPNYLEAQRLLARVLLSQNRPDQVVQQLGPVVKANPQDAQSLAILASAYQRSGDWQNAISTYKRAVQVDPDLGVAANNLAWLYTEHGGDMDVALELAQRAKRLLPQSPQVNDTLAWIYIKRDRYNLALPLLQDAVASDPANAQYQFHLGLAQFKLGNRAAATTALRKAVTGSLDADDTAMARATLRQLGQAE